MVKAWRDCKLTLSGDLHQTLLSNLVRKCICMLSVQLVVDATCVLWFVGGIHNITATNVFTSSHGANEFTTTHSKCASTAIHLNDFCEHSIMENRDEYEIWHRITEDVEYIKLIVNKGNGCIVGAMLVGDTGDLEETIEHLMRNRINIINKLGGIQLLNPNIDIEDYFD